MHYGLLTYKQMTQMKSNDIMLPSSRQLGITLGTSTRTILKGSILGPILG